MAPESENNLRLEIGHVLFVDLVGYSKLLIEEQGNISAVARKLGRPRKSLDYWIGKLRQLLKNRIL